MSLKWFKDNSCHVTFPAKDVGIDLFAIKKDVNVERAFVAIQVKESRDYKSLRRGLRPYHSWHGVSEKDFIKPISRRPDFYVFVYYKEAPVGRRIKFKEIYIVVPFDVLNERVKNKKGGYDFYFSYDSKSKKLEEWRDARDENSIVDYTKYYDGWTLIRNALRL